VIAKLREDILKPIPGDNPSGQSVRLTPVYDKIREARREDDALAQGAWQIERKVADHSLAIKLAQDVLATQGKDLQLAAWLCDSLLKREGIAGLRDGVTLCQALVDRFWDTLYPQIEEGDLEDRLAPVGWISTKLLIPVKSVPLCRAGYNFFEYKNSRSVEYEDLAKSKDQKAAREKALKDGKLAPELFDKSFTETAKAFYADLERQFDGALEAVQSLDVTCVDRFGPKVAPSFTKLQETLQEVRHIVHQLLQKKREIEPDPVEPTPLPVADPEERKSEPVGRLLSVSAPLTVPAWEVTMGRAIAETADGQEPIATIAAAAAALRKRDAFSPAPYLMLRGLRWGELRATRDPAALEAPPSELRQQIKRLALDNNWRELLELAENVMALPCSRAWLDLQRFVIEACAALGEDYSTIAISIGSEIQTLLRDLPHLMNATLNDDTPAANAETQAWLRDLLSEPAGAPLPPDTQGIPTGENAQTAGWRKKYVDPHVLALQAMRSGQALQAIEILQREIGRQASGRGRFQRRLQLAHVCLSAGKDSIAQPLLDDIAAEIENHKLDDWEERELVAGALVFVMQSSKKIQGDAKAKQTIFERICRLDAVQALSV
jgi:type VI secretion system protein ImpA